MRNSAGNVSPYFLGETLDDVMRDAISAVLHQGHSIDPRKGKARELIGVLLEISNPRARLSQTETRGKPFSCLGELCWYLARNKNLNFISYYISAYEESADGNEIFGGYGPRLFDWEGLRQMDQIVDILRLRPDSRQAVIQLFDGHDLLEPHNDVPCTCTLQFMRRNGKVHLFVNMRSNDAFLGKL
jgi:thymidylate synthase